MLSLQLGLSNDDPKKKDQTTNKTQIPPNTEQEPKETTKGTQNSQLLPTKNAFAQQNYISVARKSTIMDFSTLIQNE